MASRRGIVRPPGFVIDRHGAFLRRVDVSHGDLENANLADADLSEAKLRGVNFNNANLKGTILRGADLREARNLPGSSCPKPSLTTARDYRTTCRTAGPTARPSRKVE